MEQSLGQDSIPASGSIDKSRVLDVRPLRCLVPVFPSAPNSSSFSTPQGAAPFVCASPAGPFPPGVTPFYPFVGSSEPQKVPEQDPRFGFSNPISNAVPINSFRTPPPTTGGATPIRQTGATNGAGSSKRFTRSRAQSQPQSAVAEEDEYSGTQNHDSDLEDSSKVAKSRGKSKKRTRGGRQTQAIVIVTPDVDIDLLLENILSSFNDTYRRSDGDRESVRYILTVYDLFRRRISQIEDAKETAPGVIKRPDLRAATLFMSKGIRTNIQKRIGVVPGAEVGDIFFFRMELCLVGLHAPSMAGIDYMGVKNSEEDPLAVSIVSSGGYEDLAEDADVLIYSGHGGNVGRKDKETKDQKLERGNLALERSLHRANGVRVIRGIKDISNPTGKIYVYDGLYKIQESWTEKGKGGYNVFKYKLVRLPGQPEAFSIWKSIEKWKGGDPSRIGVILPDLTSGVEKIPVSLVNDVDSEKGPAHFTYISSLKYSKPANSTVPTAGCICIGGCLPGNSNCPCIHKNSDWLPYTGNGQLVNQNSLLYECGSSCQCPPNCKNRVSQSGLKIRLEVFKTKDRGWGLRSWDPIRAGTFICEYAGEVIDHSDVVELGGEMEEDYIFDATRICEPVGVLPGDSIEAQKIPFPLTISAKYVGNVARFMNHSCSPNVLWQPILRENKNESDLHIAFFTVRHIPPLTELTYDYGMISYDKGQRNKKCLCGSLKCRGYYL
ncbi:hypothetical protein FNV43_RR15530 [Rhamnella rubrinervis]|uniref:Histone-lysine N-methyltransferase, H3 lysine-9 specific SUVH1 n=1 Tax=Rhamnella rubrinervis TaxID=2594499 RepID=A0A8K0E980_9ROSA|nr:hypothetical protein FNV43_RR15530 [Rhamnella rubrinervis]